MADPGIDPLITTPAELAELVEHLRGAGRFAFDTEFVSEDTFEPVLCLVQVATAGRMVVVDPLEVGDLGPFWDVVNDPAIEVVMHAAGEDLRICRMQTGRLPARVVDVQVAAGLVGFSYPLSLGNLVSQVVGASVSGGETRTDWRRRPLSGAQLRYALDDVRYLLEISDDLAARAREMGREDWVEAEYARLLESIRSRDDEDRWRRLPSLHQLNRRGLEIARRMFDWRKEEARRQNRPVRQVMRDDILIAIAKRAPKTRRDLEALRDFNRPQLLARGQSIVDLINAALAVPTETLPEHTERPEEGPGLSMVVSLLSATLTRCCAEHKVSVGLVGTTSDLKDLVHWELSGRPEGRRPWLLRGWRELVCGDVLSEVLTGRRGLRIVDPLADVPVAIEPIAEERA